MNGDRLKELETGFLDGSLSDAEETELKNWVLSHSEHRLFPYLSMVAAPEVADMPDFKTRVNLSESRSKFPWLKIAAAVLVICITGFLLKDQWIPEKTNAYSEAEIDQSYKATMETLSAMAGFLDKSLTDAEQAIDLSKPFEKLNDLKDENSK